MTPGQRDPRPTGFGPMTWLWWPVVMAGWSLAATVMAAEAIASGAAQPRERPDNGRQGSAGRSRTFRARSAVLGPLAAVLALSALAACQPLSGGPARTAELAKMRNPASPLPTTTVPPVLVPNPFFCPRRATP